MFHNPILISNTECTVSAIRGYISRQSGKVNDGGPSADKRPKTPRAPRTPKKRKLKETSSEEEPELESGHENENLQNIDALDALIKTEKDFEESASSLKDDDMIFAPVKLEDMDRMFENDIWYRVDATDFPALNGH